jgi:molecular chaperone IbpA
MTFLTTPLMRSFVGFDNLFDEFERMSEYTDNKYPAYNIIKCDDEKYKIEIAVAGFNEKDINIEVKKGLMSIEASKAKHSNEYLHRGIAERSFTKQFRISDDMEVTEADLQDGLLTINLYREIPETDKPKQIKINTPGLIKRAASAISSGKAA